MGQKNDYDVVRNILHDGKLYEAGGKPISLTEDEAAELIAAGGIQEQARPLNKDESPSGDDMLNVMDFIKVIIQAGDTEKPKVEAIKKATNVKVSAAERDAMWEQLYVPKETGAPE